MELENFFSANKEAFAEAKKLVEILDPHYIEHIQMNYSENKNIISIIMTTHNRIEQIFFTLKTICMSVCKNIHVVIVDDSTDGLFLPLKELESFNISIDYIKIKNKFWVNPCVNYNIGFRYIHENSEKVVIQNSEVCHIGDVLEYISKNLTNEFYFVFEVLAINNMDGNRFLYENHSRVIGNVDPIYPYRINEVGGWYQHHIHRNANFHFLTAITVENFNKVKGFSFDYAMGRDYDDDDFVSRIHEAKIPIKCITYDENKIYGIHQWHPSFYSGSTNHINHQILRNKSVNGYVNFV